MSKPLIKIAQSLWDISIFGMSKGEHIVRYAMYHRIQKASLGFEYQGKVLSISHSDYLCKLVGAREEQIISAAYPEYNICDLNFPDETFDAVVSDQVLEHIECYPNQAFNESYRVLKPGGIMVHTTCFMTPFHGDPKFGVSGDQDYWRYTPHGLQFLCQKFSKVISADGWGNPLMPILGGLGLVHKPIPHAPWHPLHKLAMYDRKSYSYVVWVIAQK
ncbi:methyltransferase domain-containing protein [Anabaenopsis sp. FSS-46]|uniref:class I SAM-dependent methyltransferase n=1 Tax=Anabaenopsis sp. FSS-46 TaxID=2971766 RepID=UPI002475327A|nr:class I SAM-dependent methyltransferase [Anabaenopsis sp. FSS-46]MDH6100728.1 methyltransferase domain-containing protein [Anabaenopsis sp. FSS-46]